jgi:hypothetical protein
MFAASRPISGAMSLARSAQPLTLATPQATPHRQAPVLSVPVVVGTRPEAIKVAPVMGRFGVTSRQLARSRDEPERDLRRMLGLAAVTLAA